jgi:hypothetical protein
MKQKIEIPNGYKATVEIENNFVIVEIKDDRKFAILQGEDNFLIKVYENQEFWTVDKKTFEIKRNIMDDFNFALYYNNNCISFVTEGGAKNYVEKNNKFVELPDENGNLIKIFEGNDYWAVNEEMLRIDPCELNSFEYFEENKKIYSYFATEKAAMNYINRNSKSIKLPDENDNLQKIFIGDDYWGVDKYDLKLFKHKLVDDFTWFETSKKINSYFATEKAANNYVQRNKKQYSLSDIQTILKDLSFLTPEFADHIMSSFLDYKV